VSSSSSLLISSTDFAFAMAALTRACSSFDMRRPALPVAGAALGSSVVTAALEAAEEIVSAILSANAFGRPSAVVKSAFAACLSCESARHACRSMYDTVDWNGRTLSLILWKSRTLSEGMRHASHSRYHFFSRTGFPSRERNWRWRRFWSGSRSPSSATLLFVSTSVVRPGAERCSEGEMEDTRLLASRRVRRRRSRGKFPRTPMELSVKSMQSCWSCKQER
jgi:hypothetical protein